MSRKNIRRKSPRKVLEVLQESMSKTRENAFHSSLLAGRRRTQLDGNNTKRHPRKPYRLSISPISYPIIPT
ncbi:hypothetical protein HBI56_119850 [Parastagonospora nodorum]|nr:hypothetical protein HBH53_098590 [Parastagonospora nodorum]KAH3969894.1 hypothetical protein HBH51_120850 [Parastagonospora nodorum]KAH3988696.1 hypothetical protein HBH52_029350 [Parastagonospora nodorum]KAH3993181.1 hypothetical protein HBI10_204670 [Parastagonospora nodorum]KAH4011115.1 hypothetical protein HBI13_200420 [Parastagonospora nodorum]